MLWILGVVKLVLCLIFNFILELINLSISVLYLWLRKVG